MPPTRSLAFPEHATMRACGGALSCSEAVLHPLGQKQVGLRTCTKMTSTPGLKLLLCYPIVLGCQIWGVGSGERAGGGTLGWVFKQMHVVTLLSNRCISWRPEHIRCAAQHEASIITETRPSVGLYEQRCAFDQISRFWDGVGSTEIWSKT
eukprot:492548-Pelagomonas_calceolata.AAC.4